MANIPVRMDTFLLAGIYDEVKWLRWSKTKSAKDGEKPPEAILPILLGIKQETEKETNTYADGNDFEAAWRRLGGK